MLNRDQISKRIALLRRKEGLSQAELAERLGVTTQAVSKWECAQTLPDIELILNLSELFGITSDNLLSGDDENRISKSNEEVFAKMKTLGLSKRECELMDDVASYFTVSELDQLADMLKHGEISLSVAVKAVSRGKTSAVELPYDKLPQSVLRSLSAECSEVLSASVGTADRGLRRILPLLRCPKCKTPLKLSFGEKGTLCLNCENGHSYPVTDGVADFGTREIKGELWSLTYRNYEHYLQEATFPELPVYTRGEVFSEEIKWREIEKFKPGLIVDMASGTGSGIKYIIERIHWPCTVVMTDLSHRILAWDRRFIAENKANPYVDMVYLACDCANLPIADNTVDCVFSRGGFESMQHKMTEGFHEGCRILKPTGKAVYCMSAIESKDNPNSQKWISLLLQCDDNDDIALHEKMIPVEEWKQRCEKTGYRKTEAIKVYDELPAPDKGKFPFENQVLRWMALFICISEK